jgi:hypothetical protein
VDALLPRRGWRDRQGKKRVPTLRRVFCAKLSKGFQAQRALHLTDRQANPELWPHAEYSRPETTNGITRSAVAPDLLINISDNPGRNRLGQLMRDRPIQVEIDTALVVCRWVRKIVSEAGDRGKFIAELSVEVGVPTSEIDSTVSGPNIGDVVFAVETDRDVASPIDHEIVDILVPF